MSISVNLSLMVIFRSRLSERLALPGKVITLYPGHVEVSYSVRVHAGYRNEILFLGDCLHCVYNPVTHLACKEMSGISARLLYCQYCVFVCSARRQGIAYRRGDGCESH